MDKKPLWFKAKNYGWGWYPVTWQGWLVLAVYLLVIFGTVFTLIQLNVGPDIAPLIFLPVIALATVVMIIICFKTGEKPEWRWGKPKDSRKE